MNVASSKAVVEESLELQESELDDVKRNVAIQSRPYSAFGKVQRRWIVFLVAAGAFWSPITANVFFPAIPLIANDLGVSVSAINNTVTLYLIAQGISPSLWSPMADTLGRRPIFVACLTLFIGASIGLSVAHEYGELIALRFLQACGSATVISLGAGSVGDVASPSERGVFYGIYSVSLQLGPSMGPVLGGVIAGRLGWNAIFIVLAAGAGAVVLCLALFLPETLRAIVEDGSRKPPWINRPLIPLLSCRYREEDADDEPLESFRARLHHVKPLDSIRLLFEKDMACLLAFIAVQYAIYTASVVSLAQLLQTIYGLDTLKIGLCFIANGVGALTAGPVVAWLMNRAFRDYAKHHTGKDGKPVTSIKDIIDLDTFPIEKARLTTLAFPLPVSAIGFLLYGWLIGEDVYLAGPLIAQYFIGLCTNCAMSATSTLLIDNFPSKSASITASNNLCRCLLGAAVTATIAPMLNALGAGWSFTLLTGIYIISLPLLWLVWTRGMTWRQQRSRRLAALQHA